MSSEPECKCFYPASHEPGCKWKIWKDGGSKPILKDHQPEALQSGVLTAHKSGLLNMGVIDPSISMHMRVLDPTDLAKLCDSIRLRGIINPITVELVSSSRYKIIDGFRRYTVAKQLGYTTIPAYIVKVRTP